MSGAIWALFLFATARAPIPPPALFFRACEEGDVAAVTDLLLERPSLVHATNRDGDHCIHVATSNGNLEMLRALLEKGGANPNVGSHVPRNKMRIKPLGLASVFGRHDAVELLLSHGADVNADFDLELFGGGARRVTPLDAVEMIMAELGITEGGAKEGGARLVILDKVVQKMASEQERNERFEETRDLLTRSGAKSHDDLSFKEEL